MFKIEIYEDKNGYSEIAEWINELDNKAKTSKQYRIRLKKLSEQLELLKNYGTLAGLPFIKHITGTRLWELRPARDRVIFAHLVNNSFILLNHFVKKTAKTPPREIEKAKRILKDYLERSK